MYYSNISPLFFLNIFLNKQSAHEKAKEFRETNKQDKEIYEEEFFKVSNDKNLSKMKKRLDYKNTHFHNPMIQRHDLDSQKENGL